jgi:hypothetical protein
LGMGYDAATFFDQRNWKTLVTWISLILAPVCVWVALYLTREPIPLSVPRGGGDGSGVSGSGSSGNGCSGGDKYGDEGGTRSRVAAVVGKATKQSTQSYCTGVGHIVWLWNPLDSCTVLCMGAAAFWKFICTPEFMVATGFMTIEQVRAEKGEWSNGARARARGGGGGQKKTFASACFPCACKNAHTHNVRAHTTRAHTHTHAH